MVGSKVACSAAADAARRKSPLLASTAITSLAFAGVIAIALASPTLGAGGAGGAGVVGGTSGTGGIGFAGGIGGGGGDVIGLNGGGGGGGGAAGGGTGGQGGDADAGAGGTGGGAGAVGNVGVDGAALQGGSGGGGGGGGNNGNGAGTANLASGAGNFTGGNGGVGGAGGDGNAANGGGGGGGGAGGFGVVITGAPGVAVNTGTIFGGNGGAGGAGGTGLAAGGNGSAGDGGAGLVFSNTGGTLTNSGSITGGTGAVNGVGVLGDSMTVINSGSITGGGAGTANAITFGGNTNVLELQAGYAITGNVTAVGTGDTFRLGGTANSTFDVSGLNAQYTSFETLRKVNSSTWILTGTTTAQSNWSIDSGTLSISSDGALGDAATSTLSLNGGVLQATATFSTAANRAINITAADGTIDVTGTNNFTVANQITSAAGGGLTKTGTGTLTLTNAFNSYDGGTTFAGGAVSVAADSALGTGGLTFAGGTLQTTATFTTAKAIDSGTGGTFDVTGTNNLTLTGTLTGSGALSKTAVTGSTLTLNGNGLGYTGVFTLAGGTLSLGNSNALGAGATILTTGSIIDYANGVNDLAAINVNSNTTQLQVTAGTATQTGVISETAGPRQIEKIGGGILNLAGVNAYTGQTLISAGTLGLTGAGSIATSSRVNVAGGAIFDVSGVTPANATITSLTGSGNVTLGTKNLLLSNAADTFAGSIGGTGGIALLAGAETLSGTNTFAGNAIISGGGTLTITGGSAIADATSVVTGTGTFRVLSSETIASYINSAATSSLSMNDADTQDTLTMAGGYLGTAGSTMNLDIALGGPGVGGAQLADKIVVQTAGAFLGTTTVNLTNLSGTTLLQPDILVADLNGPTPGTLTQGAGFSGPGLIQYSLLKNGDDWFVHSSANLAAVGGIAGNIAIVQSTLGAIVNRPSSPFVAGLAADVEPNHCGPGPWMRAVGGAVNASGSTTSPASAAATADVALKYGGVQFGLDVACFNVKDSGFDVAVGVIAGANAGRSSQAVPNAGTTNSTFGQGYGGIYATVAKDAFSADIQGRVDATEFTFDNLAINLDNAKLSTLRYTLSGSASYAIPVKDFNIVPTVGFSFSRTTASTLTFNTGQTLTPDPSLSLMGFLGATIAKTIVQPDQVSAITPFATGTVYNDFASGPTSVFADPITGVSQTVTSQNLGTIGEVSLGMNYVKVLEGPGAKQVNATIRADVRFSDRVLGAGLTGQVRAQF